MFSRESKVSHHFHEACDLVPCVGGGGGGKGALDPPSRYRNVSTNSPCQHLRKCKENSMENMDTDVRV